MQNIKIPFVAFSTHIKAINAELEKWRAECELSVELENTTRFERFYGDDSGPAPAVVKIDEITKRYILNVYQVHESPPVEIPYIPTMIITSPYSLLEAGSMITHYLNARYSRLSKEDKKALKEHKEEEEKLPW